MSAFPLAYHITFGTYGTRLHGDPRGTVARPMNRPGDRYIEHDPSWHRMERSRLRYHPVRLTQDQRIFVESSIPDLCCRGHWKYITSACQTDYVHVLLSGARAGDSIRRLLKRWLSQAMSAANGDQDDAPWWAEGGSVRSVTSDRYLESAFRYVREQCLSQNGRLRKPG